MRLCVSLSAILITCISFAQEFEISGKIIDNEKHPLEAATIYAEKVEDSSLVSYTISEKDGSFLLKGNTEAEKINLFISYTGFVTHTELVALEEEIDLGTIPLIIMDNTLEEITLTANRAPITVKRDTLEFNAGSFKTRQDANLEDLLKKLPGVEIDLDGNITVNGKPVSRILVNGKEFFGNDPQIATKNLPKEIIDRVQVTDTKTKSEEFTGKAGDPDNKTINIKLKQDKNKGHFGRLSAGGGTHERYALNGMGNYFKDDLRLSVLGSSNNINSSGFKFDDVFGMMTNSGNGSGFSGGITKSETAGVNFTNEWENGLELDADYFFGGNDTRNRTRVNRENILPNTTYYTNSLTESNLINDSHRAHSRFQIEFDTLTRLSINPRFNSNIGMSTRTKDQETLDKDMNLRNNLLINEEEDLKSASFSNRIDFIKRFGSRGSYFQLDFQHSHSRQENDNIYYSERTIFSGNNPGTQIQDQYIDEDEKKNTMEVGASKRNVLAKELFLDLNYNFSASKTNNVRNIFNLENGDYSDFDEFLSNDFEVRNFIHTPNAGINFEGETWRIGTKLGLLSTNLQTNNFRDDISYNNTFNNVFANADVRYSIDRAKNILFGYETNVNVPALRQLQPVEDRTNPINILVGNPELKPAYIQRARFQFRNFDFSTRSGFFANITFDFTDNKTVTISKVNKNLVRRTTYTNVDGIIDGNFGLRYTKSYKKDESEFKYYLALTGGYNHDIGFINAVKYTADRIQLTPRVRFTYGVDDLFEINPSYSLTYNFVDNSNNKRDRDFTNHNISLETTSYWPENVIFGNDLTYRYFGNSGPDFDNSSLLWNISLGYQFLKEKADLTVKVYDLLDENIDTRRFVGDDSVQDISNLVLKRYGMLSFTYRTGNMGGVKSSGRRSKRFRRR